MKRLAIITTHPIQYNAPLFQILAAAEGMTVKVFYTWGESAAEKKYDPGFGATISWDIPLLKGYDHVFVQNISADPGSHHFKGINNPTLITEVKNWQPTAILVYGWSFKSHLKLMRHFKGKLPVLFRGDSISLNQPGSIKTLLRKLVLRWVYKNIDHALYVGKHNKDYFIESGLKPHQLSFAGHAIDNERFFLEKQEVKVDYRTQLGIPESDTVFLYAGKLDKNKNTAFLATVFITMPRENVHLIIAGNGVEEPALRSEFSSKKNIHFLPFQNQSLMPALYAACDVFVLPSVAETWGLAVNEAMACGKAVLVSNGCGCAIDLVLPQQNGYQFQLNNTEDLRNKLSLLNSNKIALQEMGKRSREIIAGWNFYNIARAIESLVPSKKEV